MPRRAARLLPRLLLALVAASLVGAAPADAARGSLTAPTPVAGAKWNVKVIRVYDATPRLYREGVDMGIREWNAANIGIRFARTTNPRTAHVIVRTKRLIGGTTGLGTLGMDRPAGVWLDTALVATRHDERNNTIFNVAGYAIPEEIAETMTHELGHVLGLAHTSGCSLMLYAGARDTCGDLDPPEGMWSCRMIERRDLLAAAHRYGGRGVLRRQTYCPLSATRAGRVGAITASAATRTIATTLTWVEVTNRFGYVVARSAPGGTCPGTPEQGAMQRAVGFAEFEERWNSGDAPLAPVDATYCYSVWSRNGRGTLTGPTTKQVVIDSPAPSPVTGATASVTSNDESGATVQLGWTNPTGTTLAQVYQYPADGSCVVPTSRSVYQTSGSEPSATVPRVAAGTWTFAVVRSSDPEDAEDHDRFIDFPSAPACANVTVTAFVSTEPFSLR